MPALNLPSNAVLLPGTGSDETFVRSVFGAALAALGIRLYAPATPRSGSIVAGYLDALDHRARMVGDPILVGGISFGAQLAIEWALAHPGQCAGVLIALPAWTGPSQHAPAAHAAAASADLVRREGLVRALAVATDGVPGWLALELQRAWQRHSDRLADALDEAAQRPAPELASLRALNRPAGIATCTDDPVHPVSVARAWAGALPDASLAEMTLDALGADREALGMAATDAWLRAHRRSGHP